MNNIGSKLKELRKRSGLSGNAVVSELSRRGFDIKDKTLYGYETGKNMPNADLFLELCMIYNCRNILTEFGKIAVDYSIPADAEMHFLKKYRDLDEHGKQIVDVVLEVEHERVTSDNEDYLMPQAAHNDKGEDPEEQALTNEDLGEIE